MLQRQLHAHIQEDTCLSPFLPKTSLELRAHPHTELLSQVGLQLPCPGLLVRCDDVRGRCSLGATTGILNAALQTPGWILSQFVLQEH